MRTAAAPSPAIFSAAARPMPLPPPVTRQTIPRIRSAGRRLSVGKGSPIAPNSGIATASSLQRHIVV